MNLIIILTALILIPLSAFLPTRHLYWHTQEIVLLTAGFISIATYLYRNFSKPLGTMLYVAIYSAIITTNQDPTALFNIIQFTVVVFIAYITSRTTYKQRLYIIRTIISLAVFQAIYALMQAHGYDPFFKKINGIGTDIVGLSGSRNQLSIILATAVPLCLTYAPYLVICIIPALMFTTTATSCVAVGITTFLYYFIQSKKKIFIISILLFTGLMSLYFLKLDNISKVKANERFGLWEKTITATVTGHVIMHAKLHNKKLIIEATTNPYLGYGIGRWHKIMPFAQYDIIKPIFKHVYGHAHNDYLEWFFNTGWMGLFPMLWLIVDFLLQYIRAEKTPMLTALFFAILTQMICALAIFTVFTAISGITIAVLYGLFIGEIKDDELLLN